MNKNVGRRKNGKETNYWSHQKPYNTQKSYDQQSKPWVSIAALAVVVSYKKINKKKNNQLITFMAITIFMLFTTYQ